MYNSGEAIKSKGEFCVMSFKLLYHDDRESPSFLHESKTAWHVFTTTKIIVNFAIIPEIPI